LPPARISHRPASVRAFQVCLVARPGAPVKVVGTTSRGVHGGLSVSPDGSAIPFGQYDRASASLMLVENFR